MTYEQADELLLLLKAAIGALGNIGDQLSKLSSQPPPSARGKKVGK